MSLTVLGLPARPSVVVDREAALSAAVFLFRSAAEPASEIGPSAHAVYDGLPQSKGQ